MPTTRICAWNRRKIQLSRGFSSSSNRYHHLEGNFARMDSSLRVFEAKFGTILSGIFFSNLVKNTEQLYEAKGILSYLRTDTNGKKRYLQYDNFSNKRREMIKKSSQKIVVAFDGGCGEISMHKCNRLVVIN